MVTLQEEAPEVEVGNCEASGQKYHDHIFTRISRGVWVPVWAPDTQLTSTSLFTKHKPRKTFVEFSVVSVLVWNVSHVCLFRLTSFC